MRDQLFYGARASLAADELLHLRGEHLHDARHFLVEVEEDGIVFGVIGKSLFVVRQRVHHMHARTVDHLLQKRDEGLALLGLGHRRRRQVRRRKSQRHAMLKLRRLKTVIQKCPCA